MASVTQRISKVKQPYGGYLPMKLFNRDVFDDGITLNENENIHASIVGTAVDYLTRFILGESVEEAFHISLLGANNIGMYDKAAVLKGYITGLDDLSVISACKLAGFDVCHRSSRSSYKPIEDINPDTQTIENIVIMVNRSLTFFDKYGPIVCSEFEFFGGYTDTVDSGDGDFITKDTLWDFKVLKSHPTTKHSLQILMYYIMGLHSVHGYFNTLSNLGFFNPRLNIAYICPISAISAEIIKEIENDVICYDVTLNEDYGIASSEKADDTEALSILQVCEITGMKKSMIYADIRAGKLNAYKKGNKYYVLPNDCFEYIEYLKSQRRAMIVLTIITLVVTAVISLYILSLV